MCTSAEQPLHLSRTIPKQYRLRSLAHTAFLLRPSVQFLDILRTLELYTALLVNENHSPKIWGWMKASKPSINVSLEVKMEEWGGNIYQAPPTPMTPPHIHTPPPLQETPCHPQSPGVRALGPVVLMIRPGTRITNWILKSKAFNSLSSPHVFRVIISHKWFVY